LDRSDNWFVLGQTTSADFPVQNAAQPVYGGTQDTCIAKIGFDAFAGTPGVASPGKIAFVSNRDTNLEIYVMNDDGTNQTRLTNNTATDDMPNFSRDGARIVFSSNRNGNREIYTMNADGTAQVRRTVNAASDYDPVYSPNGARIAFVSNRDGNPEIYEMNSDGSNVVRMTTNAANDDAPAWSADGTALLFHSNRGGNNDIYVMDAAVGGVGGTARLTTHPRNEHRPTWSPDGSAVAFQSDRNGNYQIFVMGSDGLRQRNLTSSSAIDTYPCFSPDGGSIAFTTTRGGGDQEIYTMRRTGEGLGMRQLTNHAYADYDATWAPGSVAAGFAAQSVSVPIALPSTITADTAKQQIRLVFTGAVAQNALKALSVSINGGIVPLEDVTLSADSTTLTLQLPQDTLHSGDKVQVTWSGGQDTLTVR
jgi:Tol biopolymer transport system component